MLYFAPYLQSLFLTFQSTLAVQTEKWFILAFPTSTMADSSLISNAFRIHLMSGLLTKTFLFQLVSLEGDGINSTTVIFRKKIMELQRLPFCFKQSQSEIQLPARL